MDRTSRIIDLAGSAFASLVQIEKKKLRFENGKKFWLYPAETRAIRVIGENPEANVSELAKKLEITKSAVSKITSKLQKKGLLIKYKDTDNQKDVLVRLTLEGTGVSQRAQAGDARYYKLLREKIDAFAEPEKEIIISFLGKLDEVMKEFL